MSRRKSVGVGLKRLNWHLSTGSVAAGADVGPSARPTRLQAIIKTAITPKQHISEPFLETECFPMVSDSQMVFSPGPYQQHRYINTMLHAAGRRAEKDIPQ
jgi:hypothetical protein